MSETQPKPPTSVLVVDDKEDIRAFIAFALESQGYEVRTAPEGAQALAMLLERPADLLITDIFMPGQEGFETIERCKAQSPRTRIVAMSAGSARGIKQDFLEAAVLVGVDATLRKPFSADQLLDTVRKTLLR